MLELMPHDHQILDDCVKSNDCDGTTSVSICSEEKLPRSTVNDEKVLRTGDREERHILITTNSQYIRPGDSGGPGTGTGQVQVQALLKAVTKAIQVFWTSNQTIEKIVIRTQQNRECRTRIRTIQSGANQSKGSLELEEVFILT